MQAGKQAGSQASSQAVSQAGKQGSLTGTSSVSLYLPNSFRLGEEDVSCAALRCERRGAISKTALPLPANGGTGAGVSIGLPRQTPALREQ